MLNGVERVVVVKAKLWGESDTELLGAHLAEESGGAIEGLLNLSDSFTAVSLSQKGDNPVDLSITQIWRYHHRGDRNQAESWISDSIEMLRDQLLDPLANLENSSLSGHT